jgi:hypothetical protein
MVTHIGYTAVADRPLSKEGEHDISSLPGGNESHVRTDRWYTKNQFFVLTVGEEFKIRQNIGVGGFQDTVFSNIMWPTNFRKFQELGLLHRNVHLYTQYFLQNTSSSIG